MDATRESIVCEGIQRPSDAMDVLLLNVKPRPVFAVLGSLMLMGALVVCVVSLRAKEPSYLLPSLLVYLALYAFVYVPWNVRRLASQNPLKGLSSRCEVTDAGLTFSSERGQLRMLWTDFRRWRCNAKVTLLYATDSSLFPFPAHYFTTNGTYLEFRALVAKHLGDPS